MQNEQLFLFLSAHLIPTTTTKKNQLAMCVVNRLCFRLRAHDCLHHVEAAQRHY